MSSRGAPTNLIKLGLTQIGLALFALAWAIIRLVLSQVHFCREEDDGDGASCHYSYYETLQWRCVTRHCKANLEVVKVVLQQFLKPVRNTLLQSEIHKLLGDCSITFARSSHNTVKSSLVVLAYWISWVRTLLCSKEPDTLVLHLFIYPYPLASIYGVSLLANNEKKSSPLRWEVILS